MIHTLEAKDSALLTRALGVSLRMRERDAVVVGAVCEELRHAKRKPASGIRELVGVGVVPEKLLCRVLTEPLPRGIRQVADRSQTENAIRTATRGEPERKVAARGVAHGGQLPDVEHVLEVRTCRRDVLERRPVASRGRAGGTRRWRLPSLPPSAPRQTAAVFWRVYEARQKPPCRTKATGKGPPPAGSRRSSTCAGSLPYSVVVNSGHVHSAHAANSSKNAGRSDAERLAITVATTLTNMRHLTK